MKLSLGAKHDILRKYGVPPGWKPSELGSLADIIGGATPSRTDRGYWSDGEIPWATPTDITVNRKKYISETDEYINQMGLNSCSTTLLPRGTILYTSRATIGEKAIAAVPITTNQGFANFIPRNIDGEFLYYLLDLLTPVIIRLGSGTTFDEVNKRDIRKIWCAVPSHVKEQEAIARVLSAIDTVIERTWDTIAQVQNLRRALMQELMPPWIGFRHLDVSQNPPGIETIEIAKDVANVCNGSTPSRAENRYWRDGTIPWIATGKVHDRVISAADELVTPAALRECSINLLPQGTVLVAMIGQGRTRGMSAYLDLEACINQNFGAFVPRKKIFGKWLFYYFDYHYSRVREIGGGTNQGALNCYLLKRIRLPLPEFGRQREIAGVLDEVEQVEQARKKTLQHQLELKAALFHELLTGIVRVNNTYLTTIPLEES